MAEKKRPANCPKREQLATTSEEFKLKYAKKNYKGFNAGKLPVVNFVFQVLRKKEGNDVFNDFKAMFTSRQEDNSLKSVYDEELGYEDPENYYAMQARYTAYNIMLDWAEVHLKLAGEHIAVATQSMNVIGLTLAQTQLTCNKLPEPETIPYMKSNLTLAYTFSRDQLMRAYRMIILFNFALSRIAKEIKIPEFYTCVKLSTSFIEVQSEQHNQRAERLLKSTEDRPKLHEMLAEVLKPIQLDDTIDIEICMRTDAALKDLHIFIENRGATYFDQTLTGQYKG